MKEPTQDLTVHTGSRNTIVDPEVGKTDNRLFRIRQAIMNAGLSICTERAVWITRYFRRRENRKKPVLIGKAEALRNVLLRKTIEIYPDELLVGNFSSKRVGGSIYPELHGIPVLEDLFVFAKRRTNPLRISFREKMQLLGIIPFWLFRFIGFRAYRSPMRKLRFLMDQMKANFYIINESGGIAHLAPDYPKLLRVGTDGMKREAEEIQRGHTPGSEEWLFLEAVKISADAIAMFGERYAERALSMANETQDPIRKTELEKIAEVCRHVPRHPAQSFHEALQSMLFVQIVLNLESLDNGISPGRMDQYLYPYYRRDIEAGRITDNEVTELLGCFFLKLCELIPVFSTRLTKIHSGLMNGQAVIIGGMTPDGMDAVNPLTYRILDIIEQLPIRQPNFHARWHDGSPPEYIDRIVSILTAGNCSPALYNDETMIPAMQQHGYSLKDARDYAVVGCVEPTCQGKSFASTDAALFNVPILLELALNEGRRFDGRRTVGAPTPSPRSMQTMEDVWQAFRRQMKFFISRLVGDLHAVEEANRRYHPTPYTSMFIDGCLKKARCSTAGGAEYNFSGIQAVGVSDAGDALYAIEKAVYREKRYSLEKLVSILRANIPDEAVWNDLSGIGAFGNDRAEVDQWTRHVAELFQDELQAHTNSRGGAYIAGIYSMTSHQYFGSVTGALPHGRRRGESFASGMAPVNGRDRNGPTALLNSMNRLDYKKFANGINFNLKLDRHTLRGSKGRFAFETLLRTYFHRGGMQVQLNILDPEILLQAKENPSAYPNLLVRVSGYSAYFADLTPDVQEEMIRRTAQIMR